MRKFAVILALGLVTAVSPASAKRDHSVPVATPIGKPVSCISLTSIRESRVRSDSIIDFKTNGNKWYRNTLPNSCPSLGFEERFAYKTSLNQLCSVDIITVLQSPGISRGASCGLGQFQPVELAKR
jgi:hypothetical protein